MDGSTSSSEPDAPAAAPFPQPLLDALRRDPDTPAFEYRSQAVSRGDVLEMIARCVTGLRAAGLGPGDQVALATGVTPAGFAAQIAAHLAGCAVIGLRPGMTRPHLEYVLAQDIAAVVADEEGAGEELLRAAAGLPLLHLAPLLAAEPAPDAELTPRGRPDDLALVSLTSGSTGQPKGCAQSYRTLSANWSWQPARWDRRTEQLAAGYGRYLLFGTLTSAVMFEHLGLSLLGGGTAVIPEPPLEFPQVFERYRATACLMTVPRLYQVLDALRREPVDTGSLRVLIVAGSPLAPHRLAEAAKEIGSAVYQGYGTTETGMLALLTPEELAENPDAAGSVGRAWVGVEVSVRDPEGLPVPEGGIGEVWVRTRSAMVGYWRDPEQTREVLRDGWVRTRDLGHLDGGGLLHLTGRSREVVIVNAIVHYVGPIEQALAAHPDVDQAYVVGAPDERTGEAVHAFVVPAGDRAPDPDALRALVLARLGEGCVPATVTALDRVPVAPSGKPDKKALLTAVLGARPDDGGATPRAPR